MKKSAALIFPLILLVSCSGRKVYEKHIKTENLNWNRFNKMNFDVPIKNVASTYDFFVTLRYIEQVPYDQVKVYFYFSTSDGETHALNHTIRLRDYEGRLLGKGMGDYWDVEELVKGDYRFREPGICRVEISSRMDKVELPGIVDVGLVVRKSATKMEDK